MCPSSGTRAPSSIELEVEKVWTKVWQMACREEDIPEVGDHITYDVVGRSILVVRSGPDAISAFHNVCLHRGRRIREHAGRDTELRCAFHGFAWELNGCLKQVPCQWDFPRLEPDEWGLPEVLVGTWGGFVFINMDLDAAPLEDHLGDLGDHFTRWPLEDRYKEAHVAKVMNCNWKVAQEAFMEAYHVVATHPQLLPSHRRRDHPVRRVRQLQSGDHAQRCAEPAPDAGSRPSRTSSTR